MGLMLLQNELDPRGGVGLWFSRKDSSGRPSIQSKFSHISAWPIYGNWHGGLLREIEVSEGASTPSLPQPNPLQLSISSRYQLTTEIKGACMAGSFWFS